MMSVLTARTAGPALAGGHHPPAEPLRIFASCENPRCTAAGLSPSVAPAGGRSLRGGVVAAHERYSETREGTDRIRSRKGSSC
jgi:hypothetical protein